jgi:lipid A disaccharide synthetase
VAPELIQGECRAERIAEETRKILADAALRQSMRAEFLRIKESLHQDERPAAIICRQMQADLGAGGG